MPTGSRAGFLILETLGLLSCFFIFNILERKGKPQFFKLFSHEPQTLHKKQHRCNSNRNNRNK
jgi:hypothetical protein